MAIGTGQANSPGRVHGRLVSADVTANTTRVLLLDVGLRLSDQARLLDLGMRVWAGREPQRKSRREEQRATGNTPSAKVPPPQISPEAQPRHEKSSQKLSP
jgi:hypothetical protein